MRTAKLFVTLLATMISMSAQSAYVRLTCVVENFSDGSPKSFRVIFDDSDRSWVVVNGSRYPYTDEFGKSEIAAFDDVKIEWCDTLNRGAGNEPAYICHAINRMTGGFLITHHRTGKTKQGECSVGRIQEKRKF